MSDSANHAENGNGAVDAAGPKLGRLESLPPRGQRHQSGRVRRGLRFWARRNFSQQQLLTSLKTMLWVAPLTILIWIYAEREQQFTPPPVTIPIQITTNDPDRLVTLKRPEEPLVMAKITGPRTGVEAVIHSWDPNYGGGPVPIPIDRNLGFGDRRIDASLIGNDPRFASHGVSVSSCQPAWLDVVIDRIVDMQLDVKPINVPSNVGSVTFTPPTVKVRGPQAVLESAAKEGNLHADADLAHRPELANAGPLDHTVSLPDVKLTLPINDHHVAIVGSPVVQAEVDLKPNKDLTLPTVTVEAEMTADLMDHYRIEYDPTLRDVTVVGPEEKIELLSPSNPDSGKYRRATFEVTQSDVASAAAGKTVEVEFKFPPGVQYKSGPRTVSFQLVERRTSQ